MRHLSDEKIQEVRRKIRDFRAANPGAKCDQAYADLFPDQVTLHVFRLEWGRALVEQATSPTSPDGPEAE